MSSGVQRRDIGILPGVVRQEMENRPVMPHLIGTGGPPASNVGYDPGNPRLVATEPGFRFRESGVGDVEYRKVGVAGREQVIDES